MLVCEHTSTQESDDDSSMFWRCGAVSICGFGIVGTGLFAHWFGSPLCTAYFVLHESILVSVLLFPFNENWAWNDISPNTSSSVIDPQVVFKDSDMQQCSFREVSSFLWLCWICSINSWLVLSSEFLKCLKKVVESFFSTFTNLFNDKKFLFSRGLVY